MGRKIRVDYSNDDDDNRDRGMDQAVRIRAPRLATNKTDSVYQAASSSNMAASYANGSGTQQAGTVGSSLPPLPQGKDLPPGMTCTDSISRTLNTLPPAQLLDTLQQVQTLAIHDPARLTELFTQAPQLTYAIFQAMLLMGLVSPDAINSVLDTSAAAPLPTAAASAYSYPGATGTPPVAAAAGYAPPPVVPSPIPVAAPMPAAPAVQDQDQLMKAVMELPQETVDQLPEAERQQIMQLRIAFASQQRR